MQQRKSTLNRTFRAFGGLLAALFVVGVLGREGLVALAILALFYVLIKRGVLGLDRRLVLALVGTAAMLTLSGYSLLTVMVIPATVYLLLQVSTTPLSRAIARSKVSVRWKFEMAISFIAVLFLVVTLVTNGAMDYMHEQLHDIQDLAALDHNAALAAVDALEDQQHGLVFSLAPLIGLFAVVAASVIGAAVARSVIDPVRRVEEGMQRIGSGDFSQKIEVSNRDELGALADQINSTAEDLKRLQDAVVAEERRRAILERMNQVATAQESERSRIARELHDGLGPSLAGLGNRLRACLYIVPSDPKQAEQEISEVADLLKGHIQEIRALSHDLRPVALDRLGLVGAITEHLESLQRADGIQTSIVAPPTVELDLIGEATVFRILQECLANVQRHASASTVAVEVQATLSGLSFAVKDDGRGFDPESVDGSPGMTGTGLRNMRERAALMGWSLSLRSAPGQGCEVLVGVPEKEALFGAYSGSASR